MHACDVKSETNLLRLQTILLLIFFFFFEKREVKRKKQL